MRKAFYSLLLCLLTSLALSAQEAATYAQYQLFPILYNPGVTGFSGNHEFVLNARKAQSNFAGTPTAYTAMYHGSVGDKLGLGAGVFSESAGDINTTRIQGNYAFRFRLQKAQIGIGLTTEFINRSIDNSLLSNPNVDLNDVVLEDLADGRQIFDASVGAHILWDQRVFVGLSLPNTVRTRLDQVPVDLPQEEKETGARHYFFHFGYIFDRSNQGYKLIPSLAVRSIRDVPFQVDLNVQGRFLDDKLIAAILMRPSSSHGIAGFMIGSTYKNAQIIYSYDIGFGPFQQYNGGSHELTLAYSIKPRQKKPAAMPGDN